MRLTSTERTVPCAPAEVFELSEKSGVLQLRRNIGPHAVVLVTINRAWRTNEPNVVYAAHVTVKDLARKYESIRFSLSTTVQTRGNVQWAADKLDLFGKDHLSQWSYLCCEG